MDPDIDMADEYSEACANAAREAPETFEELGLGDEALAFIEATKALAPFQTIEPEQLRGRYVNCLEQLVPEQDASLIFFRG